MFKQRFLTAIILIPLVLLSIYFANDWVLAGILSLVLIALGWEWTALIPLRSVSVKLLFIVGMLVLSWGMRWVLHPALLINCVLWAGVFVALMLYPRSARVWGHAWVVGGLAWLVIALFSASFWMLYHSQQGPNLLVYVLGLVWATDIGAYFAGKLWGKHKLLPKVSPGKTIEGACGGLGLAALVAVCGAIYFHPVAVLPWFVLAFGVVMVAMIGDLFISMLKRRCALKDTGQLLPGHGGILDRLDSLIAVMPFFYFFWQDFF